MKKLIAIIAIVLALGFIGFSQVKGHGEEPDQEKTQMTQMMKNQEQMMKEMNEKMDKMMNSCMGMMEKMHGSKGGMMMEHHEGMMEKK